METRESAAPGETGGVGWPAPEVNRMLKKAGNRLLRAQLGIGLTGVLSEGETVRHDPDAFERRSVKD